MLIMLFLFSLEFNHKNDISDYLLKLLDYSNSDKNIRNFKYTNLQKVCFDN